MNGLFLKICIKFAKDELRNYAEERIVDENIEKERCNIKYIMHKMTNEGLGKRNKTKRTKGLEIWYEDFENVIDEK